jgi:CubicO group peptidase (beta-lactamase class C family)
MKDGDASKSLELDGIYWMASCTKLITAISALQCVERGQFTLDESVTRLLPELKGMQIQTGVENGTGTPVFAKAKNKITLRYLIFY